LERTIGILELFTPERSAWGISQIASAVRLPRSTVHRILHVLRRHHYLWQDPQTRQFRLGSSALSLGWRALESVELRGVAYPTMQHLFQATGETVILTVLSEDQTRSVCVERIESRHELRLILEIGRRLHLHAGASSKILLAYLRDEEVERVLASSLPQINKNTITDPDRLRAHLIEIRQQGYALSFEETNEGAAGVAAPIFDRGRQIAGGLGIAGPLSRFMPAMLPKLIRLVHDHANKVTLAVGGRPAAPAGAAAVAGSAVTADAFFGGGGQPARARVRTKRVGKFTTHN
jgi:DNA-binding IclR family transcriptional regulator